jgi:PAS domain S-box-containing protein
MASPSKRGAADGGGDPIPLGELMTAAGIIAWSYDPRSRTWSGQSSAPSPATSGPRGETTAALERWIETVHAEDRGRFRQELDALASGDGPAERTWEHRVAGAGGAARWLRQTARRAGDRIAGVSVDVTREKELEGELVAAERAGTHLARVLPGMAYRCLKDENWTLEYVSDACLDLTGYSASELTLNPNLALGHLIHPDDLDMVAAKCDEALARRGQFRGEYRIRVKDGVVKWVWDQCTGIYDEAGKVLSIQGFMADITEH